MTDYQGRSLSEHAAQAGAVDALAASQWAIGPMFSPTAAAFGPSAPVLAPLRSGGFVLGYTDRASAAPGGPVRGRVYSAAGEPVGEEFALGAYYTGDRHQLQLAGLSDGRFVVLFSDRRAADGSDQLRAQIFDASGKPLGAQIAVPTFTAGGQAGGSVVALKSGGFAVFWGECWAGIAKQPEMKGQLFDASGNKVGSEFQAGILWGFDTDSSAIASAPDGSFLLVWTDAGGRVWGRRFDAAGKPAAPQTLVNVPDAGTLSVDVTVAALAGGGYALTWTVQTSGSGGDVFGQVLDASGARVGDQFLVHADAAGFQKHGSVSALKDGGFAVAWTDENQPEPQTPGGATRLQMFDAAGNKVGSATDLEPGAGREHEFTAAATLSWGGLVIAHGDRGDANGYTPGASMDVYLQIASPPGIDAHDDAVLTSEVASLTGSVLVDNGGGADVPAAGATAAAVAEVNGSAAAVGKQVQLTSGALLTLNGDGTFRYDPNGAFDSLAQFGTGASNSIGTDSFTYRLAGGDTATVTVTIRGVFSGPHHVHGTSGADRLTGTAGADIFAGGAGDDVYELGSGDEVDEASGGGLDEVRTGIGSRSDYSQMYYLPANVENLTGTSAAGQGVFANSLDNVVTMGAGGDLVALQDGGNDHVSGGAGDDYLYWGASFDNADRADGGSGYDTVGMLGSLSIVFDADDLISVEKLAVYSSGGGAAPPNSYAFATHDGNVAAGQQLMVVAQSLRGAETLAFNGAAEMDGSFNIRGGWGADTITGGAKADTIWGNLGADTLRGGAGKDLFEYNAVEESAAGSADVILDFAKGDKIALGGIDADGNAANGNSKFSWLGDGAFTNQAGQLRVSQHPGYSNTWMVEGDTNGDGTADFVLYFVAPADFVPERSDFYL